MNENEITSAEAMAILGVAETTLGSWRRDGKGPAWRPLNYRGTWRPRVLYNRDSVLAFAEQRAEAGRQKLEKRRLNRERAASARSRIVRTRPHDIERASLSPFDPDLVAAQSRSTDMGTPESELAIAVIVQAFRDVAASDYYLRIMEEDKTNFDPDLVRGDARRFLTMTWGEWCESRELWCQEAGLDAEVVRRAGVAMVRKLRAQEESNSANADNGQGENNSAAVVSLDAELARLVELEKDYDADQVTRMLERLARQELAA